MRGKGLFEKGRGVVILKPISSVWKHMHRKIKSFLALALLMLSMVMAIANAFAEDPRKEESIRELIMRLDKDYNAVSSDLLKLDQEIKNYPDTTINMTVVKKDPLVELISIEISDNEVFVKNHFYNASEISALDAGGRHQIHSGAITEGGHNFKIIYFWRTKGAAVQKSELMVKLQTQPAKSYFIELSLEKSETGARLKPSQLEIQNK